MSTSNLLPSANTSPRRTSLKAEASSSKQLGSSCSTASALTANVVTKGELYAWWAYNAAFEPISIVVMSMLLPMFLEAFPRGAGYAENSVGRSCVGNTDPCWLFNLGSMPVSTEIFAYYILSASAFMQALVFIASASLADHGNMRKIFLMISTLVGAVTTMLFMILSDSSMYVYSALFAILLSVCFGASNVFYNSYLPLLTKNHPDYLAVLAEVEGDEASIVAIKAADGVANWLSTVSFIVGYGSACVALVFTTIFFYFNRDSMLNMRYVLAACGLWWMLVAAYPLISLKYRKGPDLPPGTNYFTYSWCKIFSTLSKFRRLPQTFIYLACYFVFSDAYNTISMASVIFARNELKLSFFDTVICVGLSTATALLGNYCLFYVQRIFRIRSKSMVVGLIVALALIPMYIAAGIWAKSFGLHQKWEIYAISLYYGFLNGAIQSFSRVVYAEMIPMGEEAEFFALYAVTDKGGSWIGPLALALIGSVFGSPRYAMFFLIVLLLLPMPVLVYCIDESKAKSDCVKFSREMRAGKSV